MTERPLSITTQFATPSQTVFTPPTASISANDVIAFNDKDEKADEPYTIKCICDYSEDDGATVYCETCDTWQHIECFYPGRVEDASRADFRHSCADCKPRPLDKHHATERQRHQRQNRAINDSAEKKTKRPPSKSHKKKSKPSDLQVNGYLEHDGLKNGSPQEHHPHTKKAKGHHRASQSITSQAKRSPSYNVNSHTHAHPPSPAHTPPELPKDFRVHSYSDHFLTLYNDTEGAQPVQNNSFASLDVTNAMSLWLRDPDKLREDSGVKDKIDVFQNLLVTVDTLKWPELRVARKEMTFNDAVVRWRCLITPTPLNQAGRIGELNGLIGFQKDYTEDSVNQWKESGPHPRPFVFFHPRLPIFIDARREGSKCRYVRRSCRPNTALETYIASGSEYHFWLVSERPLAAGEQITLAWDFRLPSEVRSRWLRVLDLGDDEGEQVDGADISEIEYEQLATMIDLVLSDHGGCACELGSNCAFARFHRNYYGIPHTQSNGTKKKGRKPKTQASPTSTGQATNSRAASEGQQEVYDAEDDSRSVSGSIRSKPQSRDMTPLLDQQINGNLAETSNREKRKLAMEEHLFQKQQQGQPPRKKKRPSDGSNVNVPGNAPQPTPKPRQKSVAPRMSVSQTPVVNGTGPGGQQHVDSRISRRESGSPYSAISPPPLPSPQNPASRRGSIPFRSRQTSLAPVNNYQDSITQTEPVDNAWYSDHCKATPLKKPIISLAKHLMKNRKKTQARLEAQQKEQTAVGINGGEEQRSVSTSSAVSAMDLDTVHGLEPDFAQSPTDVKGRNASIVSFTPSIDATFHSVEVNMTDAPPILVANLIKPPPPPWPPTTNMAHGVSDLVAVHKSRNLQVQLPPTPTFSTPNMSGSPSGPITPSSAGTSVPQSPLGTVHFPSAFSSATVNGPIQNPSPVRTTKKLSLSDYKKRLKRTDTSGAKELSAGSSPTVMPAVLKPSLSTVEEAKAPGVVQGCVIVDSPVAEKTIDPLTGASVSAADTSPSNNLPSERTNGIL